jgi:putative transposase
MNKTFQYRLYPTHKQETLLKAWLVRCCEVYNAALQERRDAYRMTGVSLSYSHQCAELPNCKEVRPELTEMNSQVLQDVLKRVDRAIDGFFRRVKDGQQPGYPRFRSRLRYHSLTFKQYQNSFDVHAGKKQEGRLILSKLGHIKMVLHRPLTGIPKTATVKRTPTGKWFVSISVETEQDAGSLPSSEEPVGIDVGLKTFAYLSTGGQIDNPRFFRKEEQALSRAHRKLSKARHGTLQREKRRKVVARNMLKNPKLAKSIADAAWSSFFAQLLSKAAEAGREVVRVSPAYTSQTCSGCGHRQEMPLSVRVYECPVCGLVIDRDYNGSQNILDAALEAVGRHGRVIPEALGLEP